MPPSRQEQPAPKRRSPFGRVFFHRWKPGTAALALLVLGAMLAGWSIRREDRRMREEFLEQTRRMAQTIPLDRLKVLNGNRADEQKPEYRRLKSQLMAAQQIDPDWEWIYLMGRRGNGAVYFQMDSEADAGARRIDWRQLTWVERLQRNVEDRRCQVRQHQVFARVFDLPVDGVRHEVRGRGTGLERRRWTGAVRGG